MISKSRGRWCQGQILHCFRGVLICIYKRQPRLAVRNIVACYMTGWERESQSFPAVCGVSGGTGSFTTASRLTETLGMFLLGDWGGGCYVDPPLFICSKHVNSEWATQRPPPPSPLRCWHRGLEMLTHGAESSPRNPRNPPKKTLGGRMRWSLGMHSEESVTYLLAELSEPCLSQPLPPRPVCPTSPSHFPLCFVL